MILVDKEFESLIPPLSPEEFAQLEENCVRDGIRDPLVVWNSPDGKILVDGHNRWKISANHGGIPFQVVERQFQSRDEVKEWIIKNQFGRRNIPAYMRAWLSLKLKDAIAAKVKEKEEERKTTYQKSEKSNMPAMNTSKELAKVAGVSHDTIHKVEVIENSGNETVKAAARSGEMSVNKAYETIKEENAALKRRVQELEQTPPQVVTQTVEVVPEDYKDAKTKAKVFDREVKRLNDKLTAAYKEREEQNKKIQSLQDEVIKYGAETQQGRYFRELESVATAFETQCEQFIRWVGGYIWITQNPGKLKPERRESVTNAVQMVYEWAGTMLHNLSITEEDENEN